jgi:hypothetical protein
VKNGYQHHVCELKIGGAKRQANVLNLGFCAFYLFLCVGQGKCYLIPLCTNAFPLAASLRNDTADRHEHRQFGKFAFELPYKTKTYHSFFTNKPKK